MSTESSVSDLDVWLEHSSSSLCANAKSMLLESISPIIFRVPRMASIEELRGYRPVRIFNHINDQLVVLSL